MQNDIIKPPKVPAYPPEPAQQSSVSVAHPLPAAPTQAPEPLQPSPSPSQVEQSNKVPSPKSPKNPQKTKNKKPVGIILLAIIVCLLLVGAAVYLKLQADKSNSSSPQPAAETVRNDDPSVTSEVDSALSETTELPSSHENVGTDLTNDALGL